MKYKKLVKPCLILLTGFSLSGILTWSAYKLNLNSIRSDENQIISDIALSLSSNIESTLNQLFMPDLIGFNGGNITRELFTVLTNPLLEISSTSFSWVPVVKPLERDSFVKESSIEYPGYEIVFIDENSQMIVRPIDNTDMWPLLHANPLFNEGLRGVDLFPFWASDIARMLSTNSTVISDLFFLDSFDNILKFSNENAVYNILQPVYDIKTSHVIGTFARLFFPSEIIIKSIEGSSIGKVDNHQISIFRTRSDDITETVFVEDRTKQSDEFSNDIVFKKGKNSYTVVTNVRVNELIVKMTSDTSPKFQTYGIILIVSLFASILASLMYFHQVTISDKNKTLASERKKALDIAIVQSEHKSKFVSEMSHEFRTPLNGIIGMMDLIRSESTSGVVKKYMGIAESCSNIMLGLVNDILDFSKIESGKMKIIRSPTHLRGFIADTIDIMRVIYRKNDSNEHYNEKSNDRLLLKLELDSSIPGGISEIDNKRVRQIIINLISNAFKFTNHGSITVKVECKQVDVEKDECRLYMSVSDTGIGMSPDGVNNLFKAFSQVHDAREIRAGGTGLGLVICKKLCGSMKGDITCESVKGMGTIFSFDCVFGKPPETGYTLETYTIKKEWDLSEPIEIKDDEENEYVVDTPSKFVSEPLGVCFTERSLIAKKPSIICADDVNVNRLILDRMMAPLTADVYFAKDGLELVNMCMVNKFSVILTDIVMPIMSGTEASRIISTGTGPNKDTPIIAISGSNDEKGLTVDSLLKPIARNLLYDKLSKWLKDDEVTWIARNWRKELE